MKKTFTLLAGAALVFGSLQAQSPNVPNADVAPPATGNNNPPPTVQSPWQVLLNVDITAAGAGGGNAGLVITPTEVWVSKWGGDTISAFSLTGTLTSQFTIPSVSGVRSMTTDGQFIYAGANTSTIFQINPATRTVASTISVPSVPNIRYCTYDATANSGQGGFWVGSWATDITLVSRTGAVLNTIPAASHGLTASYGMAFDGTSPGGPYLWSFHQTGNTNNADIMLIEIATGMPVNVMHDVTSDVGTAGDLAGGLFLTPAPLTLSGIVQGTSNIMVTYDIVGVISSIGADVNQNEFVAVYPNPTADVINVRVNRTNNDPMQIQIINAVGQVVSASQNVGMNNIYNVENLEAGVYFVQVTNNGVTYNTRFVKQ